MMLFLYSAIYPAAAHAAASSPRFEFLMRFYDLNESAFAYHRHCLSTKGAIDPVFLRTLEYVANALLAESIKDNPDIKPEYIQNQIVQRRYKIQYGLDSANINEGCYSEASIAAKEHYQEFSRYKLSDIRAFIKQSTTAQ